MIVDHYGLTGYVRRGIVFLFQSAFFFVSHDIMKEILEKKGIHSGPDAVCPVTFRKGKQHF